MEHAGVFENDNQIDELIVKRGEVTPNGAAFVQVEVIE